MNLASYWTVVVEGQTTVTYDINLDPNQNYLIQAYLTYVTASSLGGLTRVFISGVTYQDGHHDGPSDMATKPVSKATKVTIGLEGFIGTQRADVVVWSL